MKMRLSLVLAPGVAGFIFYGCVLLWMLAKLKISQVLAGGGEGEVNVMWGMFFFSIFVAVLFLYLPGYFFIRAFRITPIVGLVLAPVVTLVVYSLLCIIYSKTGVLCSWTILFVPSLTISIVLFALLRGIHYGRADVDLVSCGKGLAGLSPKATDWATLGLYVGVGMLVTVFVFVRSLDGPSSFVQEFDNVHHLGAIRGFVESGDWSSLGVSLYATDADASMAPLDISEFYPAAWHCVAALLVSALNVPVTLAANVSNFVFTAIMFPSSVFLLARQLFARIPLAVLFGAFCSLAFSAYPWGFLTFGPLYSNLSSFAVLPAVAFCFIALFSEEGNARSRIASGALFLVGLISLVFTQPNAVFTMGVFLIPFCVVQVARLSTCIRLPEDRRRVARAGLRVLFIVLVVLLWTILFNAPFMQKVVTHDWPAFTSKSQAAIDVALLAFNAPASQIALSLFVALGMAYTLFRRQYLWITCSFLVMGVLYVVDVSSNDSIKFFLTGFWYTDSYRVAASAVLSAIPLACLGLYVASSAFRAALQWIAGKTGSGCPRKLLAPCGIAALFLVTVFYPNYAVPGRYEVHTAFGTVTEKLTAMNETKGARVYNEREREFVHEVQRTIPIDSIVINEPNDGTALAYGVDGLNAYYRYLRTYGGDNESEESRIIRKRLSEIASDESVQSAIDSVGAEYLLLLDQGDDRRKEPYPFTYEPEDWRGIDSVNDGTPGFEVVLSDGDMRLYKISRS